MLKYNLERLFVQRGVTKKVPFLMKAGFTRSIASKVIHAKTYRLSAKQIEMMCKAFNCQPNDLLEWIPDKPEEINKNNPLHYLIRGSAAAIDFRNFSSEIPIDKLPDFASKVDTIKKEILSKTS